MNLLKIHQIILNLNTIIYDNFDFNPNFIIKKITRYVIK